MTALRDLARSGRPSKISDEDKVWVTHIACGKPTEYGYAAERWTISQLAKHIRENAVEKGYPALARLGKSGLHNILAQAQIKPHKTAYYPEKRDEELDAKMAKVLVVYKEVQQTREGSGPADHAVLSYDEKPGIQAIENLAPDLPPVAGKHPKWARDHQYKRHGTLSLLAGIDLYDGHILGLVKERHRSKEFIEFLTFADSHYLPGWKIRIILDNHSSHISKETMKWLKEKPNRFEFIQTPKHWVMVELDRNVFLQIDAFLLPAHSCEIQRRIEKEN